MTCQTRKFERLVSLMEQHTPQEGINMGDIPGFGVYRASATQGRHPTIDAAALFIVGQGRKSCYVGGRVFDYSAGRALAMFYPLAVEVEILEASPAKPFLAAGVVLDLGRSAEVLLRLDRIEGAAAKPASVDPSGVLSIPLEDSLLDPFIRLLESFSDPRDAAMLGESIVDEIYYRLLSGERGAELRYLLQQRGQIQQISRAVEHIHQNVDKPVSVDELAEIVHMSRPTFYENFRSVMHISPLQYAKSVKLDRAHALIREGKKANEAGYLVGYNSPSQFSREYKRHFGYAPSATQVALG
ncbi:MAG: helix-turn-helix domain-containing protein [Anaerolineae bacterium]|nr:helix-turn-helix domain-containing protein [Anaerolineae bacterium]